MEKLLICGSSAAEPIPALFCSCRICRTAWEKRGKDCRSRTAYQLGEEIRFDFGPDYLLHRERYKLHLERLKHLFITHRHKDHFSPLPLLYHSKEHSPALLTLHATKETLDEFRAVCPCDPAEKKLVLDEIAGNSSPRVFENGTEIIPVFSNHCIGALNFIFRTAGGFTGFIGTDSRVFPQELWEILSNFKFDLMILDATAGIMEQENYTHMNFRQAIETVQRLRREGIAQNDCRFLVNHFAHKPEMGLTHEEMEKFFEPHGIHPAWDGLTIPLET